MKYELFKSTLSKHFLKKDFEKLLGALILVFPLVDLILLDPCQSVIIFAESLKGFWFMSFVDFKTWDIEEGTYHDQI